ncbi:MAG TPA: hypothetical protein VFT29_19040 [Gemmatimonadaceae bacterium]|nr:hypothetical protein [Gemmatimonadaceae bacterium]
MRRTLRTSLRLALALLVITLPARAQDSTALPWTRHTIQSTTRKAPTLAVWIFRRNAAMYPESANVYDSLGDGLLAKGDTAAAIAEFRRAVDIGTRTKHPVTADSQTKLRQLDKVMTQAGKARA